MRCVSARCRRAWHARRTRKHTRKRTRNFSRVAGSSLLATCHHKHRRHPPQTLNATTPCHHFTVSHANREFVGTRARGKYLPARASRHPSSLACKSGTAARPGRQPGRLPVPRGKPYARCQLIRGRRSQYKEAQQFSRDIYSTAAHAACSDTSNTSCPFAAHRPRAVVSR